MPRGAAVVEMAVVAPVLLALLVGIIEFGWVFMAYQTITNAAREGARTATLQGVTDAEIEQRIHDYVAPAGLPQYALTVVSDISLATGAGCFVKHADDTAVPPDLTETIVYSVPYADVSLLGVLPAGDFYLSSTCSMRKEGLD